MMTLIDDLGVVMKSVGTFDEWKRLKRLARSGNSDAEFWIGLYYDNGIIDHEGAIIIQANPRRAVFWYRRAAEHGNTDGQNNLGYCLSVGHGIKKDEQLALFWLKKAYKAGCSSAASNIAIMYASHKKHRRAFLWFQRAVNMSDHDALVELGWRYYCGKGVKRNFQMAIECYQKAIHSETITEEGKQEAMYYLGLAFFEGKGVEYSRSTATYWFEQANADGDHLKASQMLNNIVQR